ncbi:hypothetical protein LCGC14_2794020 [marine sediment metagenome]|uniref:Uncharacterized protein n=1 Tax=marine sediment metagenome TaxID=412755 RepID=A0A0F9BG45_9ZZZZ
MHERKYEIKDNRLVKRSNQVPIPENEPVFIFRAKDRKALAALTAYSMVVDNLDQKEAITKSIEDFRRFQAENPDKMGEPKP